MFNGDKNIKLDEETKQNIILKMVNFINSLSEDDKIFIDADQKKDLISGEDKIRFLISAEKKVMDE